jgi:hypothetical protein
MKGQLKASTPAEYLAQLDEPRQSEVAALDALIRKAAPKLAPFIHIGILAYGPWHYKYASGREGDGFRIGVASNQNYISLYVCAEDEKGSVAERHKAALPKAKIGRSCVRFKRLSDLDQAALVKLIRDGARNPGKA